MDAIDTLLAEFIASLPTTPAIVVSDRWDVLASNPLARAISPNLTAGTNLAEATFVGDSAHQTLPEWSRVAERMAGLLEAGASASDEVADAVLRLRDELTRRGPEFAAPWRERSAPSSSGMTVTMDHPDVGRLELTYELLQVADAGQTVILGHAAPGSTSEERLFALASRVEQSAT